MQISRLPYILLKIIVSTSTEIWIEFMSILLQNGYIKRRIIQN